MGLTVITNVPSLNAQRNLSSTQRTLDVSLQRLSSGFRINSAKDDAAGLAITENMTSQIRGLGVAARNANDAISLSQTADGALNAQTDSMQRIRELAVQAANGTNSSSERSKLNTEVQQLIAEIDRVATQTEFNGNKVLSTSGGFSASFQVGANVNQIVSMTVSSMTSADLGVASNYQAITAESAANFSTRLRSSYAAAFSSGTVNGASVSDVAANTNSLSKINAINNSSAGVKAFMYGNALVGSSNTANVANNGTTAQGDIVINGVSIAGVTATVANVVDAINNKTNETGVTANATDAGTLVLFNTTGAAVTLQVNSANAATATGFTNGTTNTSAANTNGAIVLSADKTSTSIATNNTTTATAIEGTSGDAAITLTSLALSAVSVTSKTNADLAMIALDQSLNTVNTTRATLGAVQNRVESAIGSITQTSENLSSARSRIKDADFASETASLTRSQILMNAGMSILSQANSLPQMVLSLLK